jgi:hypothetical protein
MQLDKIEKKDARSYSFAPPPENLVKDEIKTERPCGINCHCPASHKCDCAPVSASSAT